MAKELPLALRPAEFVASSLEDLRKFPEEVRDVMGYAIYVAQIRGKHPRAKPLRGFGGAGVLEIVDDYDGNTYRAVYTVKFVEAVYILHAFQKKAKKGVAASRADTALIEEPAEAC